MRDLFIYLAATVSGSFATGFFLGRMKRRRTEADERADAAAAALEGFSRVDGHLLPLPTDPRWKKGTLASLEITDVAHIEQHTSSLDDSETFTVRVGGNYLTGDKLKRSKRLHRYALAVVAAYRERTVRGGG